MGFRKKFEQSISYTKYKNFMTLTLKRYKVFKKIEVLNFLLLLLFQVIKSLKVILKGKM